MFFFSIQYFFFTLSEFFISSGYSRLWRVFSHCVYDDFGWETEECSGESMARLPEF